jgi:hypothetical protein
MNKTTETKRMAMIKAKAISKVILMKMSNGDISKIDPETQETVFLKAYKELLTNPDFVPSSTKE